MTTSDGQAHLRLRAGDMMFNLLVKDLMKPAKAVTLSPEATVSKAAELMARHSTGAVMVVEGERLTGIFTERDALVRVVAGGLDPRATRLAEVMTAEPKTVGPGTSYGYALVIMQENGFRHVPVVENGKPVGIVSARNAMDPDLEEFAAEANRREHIRNTGK